MGGCGAPPVPAPSATPCVTPCVHVPRSLCMPCATPQGHGPCLEASGWFPFHGCSPCHTPWLCATPPCSHTPQPPTCPAPCPGAAPCATQLQPSGAYHIVATPHAMPWGYAPPVLHNCVACPPRTTPPPVCPAPHPAAACHPPTCTMPPPRMLCVTQVQPEGAPCAMVTPHAMPRGHAPCPCALYHTPGLLPTPHNHS